MIEDWKLYIRVWTGEACDRNCDKDVDSIRAAAVESFARQVGKGVKSILL